MTRLPKSIPLAALALVAGCETIPQGPTVTALSGTGKSSAEFRTDDVDCRRYADAQRADTPSGEAVCAPANAAVDERGSLIDGIDSAQFAGYGLQRRYNCAYVQCMYDRGDKVPLLAREPWPAPRSPWPPDPDAYYPRLPR